MLSIHCFFFFKQKTAYEMRISDWSSDVCSSDLGSNERGNRIARQPQEQCLAVSPRHQGFPGPQRNPPEIDRSPSHFKRGLDQIMIPHRRSPRGRSEEHTPELQSLMRISYAVFCLKTKSANCNTKLQNKIYK